MKCTHGQVSLHVIQTNVPTSILVVNSIHMAEIDLVCMTVYGSGRKSESAGIYTKVHTYSMEIIYSKHTCMHGGENTRYRETQDGRLYSKVY